MISWIAMLIAKIRLKNKIRRIEGKNKKTRGASKLLNNTNSKLKKLKFKNRVLNYTIIAYSLGMLLFVIVIGSAITGMVILLRGGAIGNQLMYDEVYTDDTEHNSWDWSYGNKTDYIEQLDGNYPKDYTLKIRAQLIEVVRNAAAVTQTWDPALNMEYMPDPAWLLGVTSRETGGKMYEYFTEEGADVFNTLVMTDDPCGKGNGCNYIANGYSHYENGQVVNGVDTGNPFTSRINTDYGQYATAGGDHAIGPFQLESIQVYSHLKYLYNTTDEVDAFMDDELGFVRPNPLYIPDAVQAIANKRAYYYNTIYQQSEYAKTDEFLALPKDTRNIILWCISGSMMGTGYYTDGNGIQPFESAIKAITEFVLNGGDLENLISKDHYNKEKHKVSYPGHQALIDEINASGLAIPDLYNFKETNRVMYYCMYYGIQELNLGRLEYDNLISEISNAVKDEDGNIHTGGKNKMVFPLNTGVISSYFGYRGTGQLGYHRGTDIAAEQWTPIYMPVDGIIVDTNQVQINYSVWNGENCGVENISWNGNYVIIKPVDKPWLQITLCHMAELPKIKVDGKEIFIKDLPEGTVIKAGEQIGFVGTTGCSTGNHLHFQVDTHDTSKDEYVYNLNNDGAYIGNAIPPFHSLYGDRVNEIILNSGIGLGNQIQYETLNGNIYWKSTNLNTYMFFSTEGN